MVVGIQANKPKNCGPLADHLTLGGGLLDNKSVPPIMRMWRNWQTR